jgi:hypothetical protein
MIGNLFGLMAGARVAAKCEAGRADAGALKLRPKSRDIDTLAKSDGAGEGNRTLVCSLGREEQTTTYPT